MVNNEVGFAAEVVPRSKSAVLSARQAPLRLVGICHQAPFVSTSVEKSAFPNLAPNDTVFPVATFTSDSPSQNFLSYLA